MYCIEIKMHVEKFDKNDLVPNQCCRMINGTNSQIKLQFDEFRYFLCMGFSR